MKRPVFCVSGPSGVGKGTLVRELFKLEHEKLVLSVSCTTRPPRKGEQNGVEYYFVTREQFEQGIKENAFIEYNKVFDNYYGTPRAFVREMREQGKSVLLEIEVEGALNARKALAGECRVVMVMIVPPSYEALEARLDKRGSETETQRALRRGRVDYELSLAEICDYTIVNDDLNKAVAELRAVIESEINKE